MPTHASPARRTSLRVLHLEDSELDHELEMAHLRRGGVQVETLRVDTDRDRIFTAKAALDYGLIDQILTDRS